MRSRLKFAAAVSAGIVSALGIELKASKAAVTYNPVALSTVGTVNTSTITIAGSSVPTNGSLTYTTAGSPNADTTQTTSQITGEYFSTFTAPTINQAGDTIFAAVDSGTANVQTTQTSTLAQNVNALIASESGTLTLIAHEGTYAPDRSGDVATATASSGTFNTFTSATPVNSSAFIGNNDVITDFGSTKANKNNGGSDDVTSTPLNESSGYVGVYTNQSGNLALSIRKSDLVTSALVNSVNAGVSNGFAVNPSGYYATTIDAGTASINAGIVTNASGSPQFVAEGNTACSLVAGANYNGPSFTSSGSSFPPVINATGQTAFRAGLTNIGSGTNINSSNNVAIISQGGGTLHLVAQANSQAANPSTGTTAAGDVYTSLNNPDLNNNGQLAFVSSLTTNTALGAGDIITATGASGTANNSGLFFDNAGSGVTMIARKGGTDSPTTAYVYSGFSTPLIGGSGQVASYVNLSNASGSAALTAGTTAALYIFSPSGAATQVARNGGTAPGTGGDVYLSLSSTNYAINALGDTEFTSTLAATINGTSVGTGLFAQDPSGAVDLLLQTGQSFTIAPGDISTISSFTGVDQSGAQDGKATSWNDNDTAAVDITFANGQQGIYTIAVPEPGSLSLLGAATIAFLGRRKRNRSN